MLRPGGRKKKRVIAYVESYDDIFFWRSVLSDFESETLEFCVMLPSRDSLNRGKKQAMMNQLGPQLGRCMIACVDADFDYLMQGKTPFSHDMLVNPYIIHTFVYAIENYQCYAPSLHQVCVMSTLNDRRIFDFEAYLKAYSEAIYELFVWAVWLYRRQLYSELPLNNFCNIVSVNHLNIQNPAEAIEEVRHNANRKMAYMQRRHPEARQDFKQLKEELQRLGVQRDNVYLYMQGHHIFENVVMAAIDPVCTQLRREREREIKRLGNGRAQQTNNELASYMHAQCPIDQMLRRNTDFREAEPYQQLCQRIQQFIQTTQNDADSIRCQEALPQ